MNRIVLALVAVIIAITLATPVWAQETAGDPTTAPTAAPTGEPAGDPGAAPPPVAGSHPPPVAADPTPAPADAPDKGKDEKGKGKVVSREYRTAIGTYRISLASEDNSALNEQAIREFLKQVESVEDIGGGTLAVTMKSGSKNPEMDMTLAALMNQGKVRKDPKTGKYVVSAPITRQDLETANQRQAYVTRNILRETRSLANDNTRRLNGGGGADSIEGLRERLNALDQPSGDSEALIPSLVTKMEGLKKDLNEKASTTSVWLATALGIVAVVLSCIALFKGNRGTTGTPARARRRGPAPGGALTASFLSLNDGDVVRGDVIVDLNITGGTAPYTVRLGIDSPPTTVVTLPENWDTTAVPNGRRTINAEIEDSTGATTTATVTVEVNN